MKNKLQKQLLEICSEKEVLVAMDATPLKKGFRRLNAIYLLMKGVPKQIVHSSTNKSRKTFYTWIRRFLEYGIDGLINKPRPGRPRILQLIDTKNRLIELLDEPNRGKESYYTAIKIHAYLKEEFQIEFSYRTLLRYIHEEDYNLRMPRRIPNGGDEKLRKAFKIRLEKISKDDTNEIWFEDESGFEGIAGTNRAEIASHSWKRYELAA